MLAFLTHLRLFTGNETNSTNATNTTTKLIPVLVNTTTRRILVEPNSTVDAALISECGSLVVDSSAFQITASVNATLECSSVDPLTVESGIIVASSSVKLNSPVPLQYPTVINMTYSLPSLSSSSARRLLQDNPKNCAQPRVSI